jgi:creatinine amidohydrolase
MEITQMLAEDVVGGLAESGTTHFVFVDNHAGNDPPLEAAARSLQDRLGVVIAHFYPWKVMTTWGPEFFGTDWQAVFGHGAEPNTSVMLYLTPDAVTMSRAGPGGLTDSGGKRMASSRFVEIDGVQHQLYLTVRQINDSSTTGGDPRRRPDAEIGRMLVERATHSLVQLIEWFRAHGRPPRQQAAGVPR